MIDHDSGGLILNKTTFSLIALICLIVFVSGCTSDQTNTTNNTTSSNVTSSSGTIKITSPTNGETVPQMYTVKGTVSTLKSGENLYVLIKSGNFTWWVQKSPTVSNGDWECNAQFGEDADSGKEFTVCALVTTETLTTNDEYGASLPNFIYKDEVTVERS